MKKKDDYTRVINTTRLLQLLQWWAQASGFANWFNRTRNVEDLPCSSMPASFVQSSRRHVKPLEVEIFHHRTIAFTRCLQSIRTSEIICNETENHDRLERTERCDLRSNFFLFNFNGYHVPSKSWTLFSYVPCNTRITYVLNLWSDFLLLFVCQASVIPIANVTEILAHGKKKGQRWCSLTKNIDRDCRKTLYIDQMYTQLILIGWWPSIEWIQRGFMNHISVSSRIRKYDT